MAHPPMGWQVLPKSRDPNRASPLQKVQTGAASGPNRFRKSSSPSHSTCRTPNRFVLGLRVGWETFLSFEGCRAILPIYLAVTQSVTLPVQSRVSAPTFSSTGHGGLKLERTNEHKSHNPLGWIVGRSADVGCHQRHHAFEVRRRCSGGGDRKQWQDANRGDAGHGQRRRRAVIGQ